MKQKVERLLLLHQLKKQITQDRYMELMKAEELLKSNQLKKEQLLGYKVEYLKQLAVLGDKGAPVGQLRNRINFINQLDTALSQLTVYLAQLAKNKKQVEFFYNQAKAAEDAVMKLVERVRKKQELKQQKAEQKEFDEYAQKQWTSKKINEDSISPVE